MCVTVHHRIMVTSPYREALRYSELAADWSACYPGQSPPYPRGSDGAWIALVQDRGNAQPRPASKPSKLKRIGEHVYRVEGTGAGQTLTRQTSDTLSQVAAATAARRYAFLHPLAFSANREFGRPAIPSSVGCRYSCGLCGQSLQWCSFAPSPTSPPPPPPPSSAALCSRRSPPAAQRKALNWANLGLPQQTSAQLPGSRTPINS